MRFAERILQRAKPFGGRVLSDGSSARKALERIAKALAGDAKIVKPLLVAPLESGGKAPTSRRRVCTTRATTSRTSSTPAQIDRLGLHVANGYGRNAFGAAACEPAASRVFSRSRSSSRSGRAIVGFAGIDAALEQPQNDRRVARGIGRRGGALDAAQKPLDAGRGRRRPRAAIESAGPWCARRADAFRSACRMKRRRARSNARRSLRNGLSQPLHRNGRSSAPVRRGYFGRPSRSIHSDVRSTRLPILVVLLAIVAAGTWYYSLTSRADATAKRSRSTTRSSTGTTLGAVRVSMRPRQPDESAAEHLHNTVLYAAVQAVAGPPNDVQAIRFPPGTRVLGVSVDGSTATRRSFEGCRAASGWDVRRKRRVQRARVHGDGHLAASTPCR